MKDEIKPRFTFGPEFVPEYAYCWSCMSEKPKGTPMRTALPPAPPNDFCPRCVELSKTPEKIQKTPVATSKEHFRDRIAKKEKKKRVKRVRGILPEEE